MPSLKIMTIACVVALATSVSARNPHEGFVKRAPPAVPAAPLGAVTDGLGKTVSGVTGGLTDTVGGLTGGLTKALPLEGVTKGLGTTVGGLGQTVGGLVDPLGGVLGLVTGLLGGLLAPGAAGPQKVLGGVTKRDAKTDKYGPAIDKLEKTLEGLKGALAAKGKSSPGAPKVARRADPTPAAPPKPVPSADHSLVGGVTGGLQNTVSGLGDTVGGLADPLNGVLSLVTGLLGGLVAPVGGIVGGVVKPLAGGAPAAPAPSKREVHSQQDYSAAIDKLEKTLALLKSALAAKKVGGATNI